MAGSGVKIRGLSDHPAFDVDGRIDPQELSLAVDPAHTITVAVIFCTSVLDQCVPSTSGVPADFSLFLAAFCFPLWSGAAP